MQDAARRNALVRAAARGDRAAFEVLFREFLPRIYNFIAHTVADRAEAEDLAQRTFIKAWESLPRLKRPEAFTVWLHQIARNLLRDVARQPRAPLVQRQGSSMEEGELSVPEARADGLPERAAIGRERDGAIQRAIASLPAHHSEVVVLHHLNGMPVEDIADVLGVPVGTVLSRLARARESIRRQLHWMVEE